MSQFWGLEAWHQDSSIVWFLRKPSDLQTADFSLYLPGENDKKSSRVLQYCFIRLLITFMKAPLSWSNSLANATPSNSFSLRLGFQHMNLEETHIQFITYPFSSLLDFIPHLGNVHSTGTPGLAGFSNYGLCQGPSRFASSMYYFVIWKVDI